MTQSLRTTRKPSIAVPSRPPAPQQLSMSFESAVLQELRSIERTSAVAHWRSCCCKRPAWTQGVTMANSELLPAAVLRRKAVVYVRQSTQTQVQTNLESQRRQYDLVEEARRRGFA